MDASRPLRIRLVGLLPAVLQPCGAACVQPFMNRPLPERSTAEVDDTPAVVRENGERAHAIAEQLFRDFGPAIRIEVIGLDSPRGLWLGVRHRIGKGFAIVVDGRETVRGPTEYGPIKEAVKRALDRRTAR